MEVLEQNLIYIVLGQTALLILLLILILISFSNNKKLRTSYNNFFKHKTNEKELSELLENYLSNVVLVKNENENISTEIKNIKESIINETNRVNNRFKTCIQKVDFMRYNPFTNIGGELSFVFALLDENNNGILYNSIFAEDGCYQYSKEVVNGTCSVKLSNEENTLLQRAINK